MALLYPGHSEPYVPVFRIVIFGLVPIGLTYIFGTLLTADGRLRQLNLFATASLVLNIVVNLLLIPRLGAVGSAWASLTAQGFMALAQFLLSVRLCHLPLARSAEDARRRQTVPCFEEISSYSHRVCSVLCGLREYREILSGIHHHYIYRRSCSWLSAVFLIQ